MEKDRRFLFKLAKELGYKTVRELEDRMSYNELLEWYEYYTEEPFLSNVIEVQLATLTEMVVRSFSNSKDISAIDFMITMSDEQKANRKAELKRKELFEKLNSFGK